MGSGLAWRRRSARSRWTLHLPQEGSVPTASARPEERRHPGNRALLRGEDRERRGSWVTRTAVRSKAGATASHPEMPQILDSIAYISTADRELPSLDWAS